MPSTPHHIPVKLNHQQHCCDILRSHTMYTFCGTTTCFHVMVCHWTFTVGYMSPFCIFTKFFIPIQNEPLWVHSVYEGISKVLIELLSTVLKVFLYMCYDTLILSSIVSFFLWEEFIWWSSSFNSLHPVVLSSLLHLITPWPSILFFKPQTHF
jgi:uncharacterized membrane protein YagU involved in acid resistance